MGAAMDRAQADFEAERAGKCEALVRGSIYSRKGGNRYDLCEYPAKWRVTLLLNGNVRNVCGVHAHGPKMTNARRAAAAAKYPELGRPYFLIERLQNEGEPKP